jgi:hypothetical protein
MIQTEQQYATNQRKAAQQPKCPRHQEEALSKKLGALNSALDALPTELFIA